MARCHLGCRCRGTHDIGAECGAHECVSIRVGVRRYPHGSLTRSGPLGVLGRAEGLAGATQPGGGRIGRRTRSNLPALVDEVAVRHVVSDLKHLRVHHPTDRGRRRAGAEQVVKPSARRDLSRDGVAEKDVIGCLSRRRRQRPEPGDIDRRHRIGHVGDEDARCVEDDVARRSESERFDPDDVDAGLSKGQLGRVDGDPVVDLCTSGKRVGEFGRRVVEGGRSVATLSIGRLAQFSAFGDRRRREREAHTQPGDGRETRVGDGAAHGQRRALAERDRCEARDGDAHRIRRVLRKRRLSDEQTEKRENREQGRRRTGQAGPLGGRVHPASASRSGSRSSSRRSSA